VSREPQGWQEEEAKMAKSEEEIESDIKAYIQRSGSGYRAWYVGISKDARDRLFRGHGVHEKGDWWIFQGDSWIFRRAQSSTAARNIEAYFVNTLDTNGAPGGGDKDADYVYAYKKAAHTTP
jgi:hypothetical protein